MWLKCVAFSSAATDDRDQSEPAGGFVLADRTRCQRWSERRAEGASFIDLTMTARIRKAYITAGMNTGRTEVDYCGVVTGNPQVVPVVATTATAGVAAFTQPRNSTFCDTVTPWGAQTQVKAAAVYAFPFDIRASASFQHFPGATQAANIVANSALIELYPRGVHAERRRC